MMVSTRILPVSSGAKAILTSSESSDAMRASFEPEILARCTSTTVKRGDGRTWTETSPPISTLRPVIFST